VGCPVPFRRNWLGWHGCSTKGGLLEKGWGYLELVRKRGQKNRGKERKLVANSLGVGKGPQEGAGDG